MKQLAGRLGAVGETNLDFLACLGGARPARAFVGDPIFLVDRAQAERLVGRGKIARGDSSRRRPAPRYRRARHRRAVSRCSSRP